jgi:ADP-ribose pyrophosphatase YjhB (NUDIX family)
MVDLVYRLAYRWAYRGLRVYWRVAHPTTQGALVALWWQGELLLVQNSYVPFRSLPGGTVNRGETGRQAAIRELREEVGIVAREEDLLPVVDQVHEWEGKRDHVQIFELELDARPDFAVDNREVVAAGFYSPERALALPLFPLIPAAIAARAARLAGGRG